jgi:hypothetical protein
MTTKNWNLKTMETENKKRYKEHGKIQDASRSSSTCPLVYLFTNKQY